MGFTIASERSRLKWLLAGVRRGGYLPKELLSLQELARFLILADSSQSDPSQIMFKNAISLYLTYKKHTGLDTSPYSAHSFPLHIKDSLNFVSRRPTLYGALMSDC